MLNGARLQTLRAPQRGLGHQRGKCSVRVERLLSARHRRHRRAGGGGRRLQHDQGRHLMVQRWERIVEQQQQLLLEEHVQERKIRHHVGRLGRGHPSAAQLLVAAAGGERECPL